MDRKVAETIDVCPSRRGSYLILAMGRFVTRLPLGFLGMVVLVVVMERQLRRNDIRYIENGPVCWKYSFERSRSEVATAEILCLGSSLTKFAVHPELIARKTGHSAYNFGLYGGRAASSYYLLAQLLNRGARPRAIVLDFFDGPLPTVACFDSRTDLHRGIRFWEELLTYSECVDLSLEARDPAFLAEAILGITVPSIRGRSDIRFEILNAVKEIPGESRTTVYSLLRNWNVNRGSQVMPVARKNPSPEPAAPATEVMADRWENHRLMEIYTQRLLKLTRERGIPVYWIMPPLSADVIAAEELSGFAPRVRQFADRMVREHSHLILVDARSSGYDRSLFHDATHLNEAGMRSFSEDLGAIIAQTLNEPSTASRVHVLPHYQPRRDNPTFENLNQSRVAVDGSGSRRS
jgi:hypothetical protein